MLTLSTATSTRHGDNPSGSIESSICAELTPIALFVFNRPEHTRRCLQALLNNSACLASPLYIFCDGPRTPVDESSVAEVRAIVDACPHPDKIIHPAHRNLGLANSIISGVTCVLDNHERVIVVEDDLIVGPSFLTYLNQALDRYRDDPQVMQIAAHMYPVDAPTGQDAFFLPLATSWGWATWRRAWARFDASMSHYDTLCRDSDQRARFNLNAPLPYFEFLHRQRTGRADSWYIRWYLSIFMNNGLVLYPKHSHVRNQGFDGTGIHCGVGGSPYDSAAALPLRPGEQFPATAICEPSLQVVRRFLTQQNRWHRRVQRRVHAMAHAWWAKLKLNVLRPG